MAWNSSIRSLSLLAVLSGVALWLHPIEADACSPDPCAVSDRWVVFEPLHDAMLTDGVIVFTAQRGTAGRLDDAAALEHVSLSVMTTDGVEVPGALELVPGLSAVLFRPDEPLRDGTELELSARIDNDAIDDMEQCTLYTADVVHTLSVVEGSMMEFELDALELESHHELAQHVSYDTLVCCDGAYPADLQDSCGWAEIHWSPGFCTATRGTGYAIASLALPGELDEPALSNLLVRLVADDDHTARALASTSGSLRLQRPNSFSAHYEIVNLATGDLVKSEPVDVGADVLDALGELDIDPASALAAACSGEAYVCETDESEGEGHRRWDPEQCVPYEGEPEETDGPDTDGPDTDDAASGGTSDLEDRGGGCSCNAEGGAPKGLGLLALFGLGGMSIRRRRR